MCSGPFYQQNWLWMMKNKFWRNWSSIGVDIKLGKFPVRSMLVQEVSCTGKRFTDVVRCCKLPYVMQFCIFREKNAIVSWELSCQEIKTFFSIWKQSSEKTFPWSFFRLENVMGNYENQGPFKIGVTGVGVPTISDKKWPRREGVHAKRNKQMYNSWAAAFPASSVRAG